MSPCEEQVAGIEQAIARYGQPLERSYTYDVTPGTLAYWDRVLQKRDAEVVLVLRRASGHYLVHTKPFYPTTRDGQPTYRLLSGGIEPGEELVSAVLRETREETNLEVRIVRFLGILRHCFQLAPHSCSGQGLCKPLRFTSYVFALRQVGGGLRCNDPGESITGFCEVSPQELGDLAEQLEGLPAGWEDWGRFRASAHRFVAQHLC